MYLKGHSYIKKYGEGYKVVTTECARYSMVATTSIALPDLKSKATYTSFTEAKRVQ